MRVVCDRCKTEFFYELTRVGMGKASAPFLVGVGAANGRAERAADKDLAKRLAREAELVPCPKCNWINEEAIAAYRATLYHRLPLIGGIVTVAGIIAGPIIGMLLLDLFGNHSRFALAIGQVLMLASLLALPAAFLLRRQLRRRFDPNSTYPRRPDLPPGTPIAFVPQVDPKTGERQLVPAPRPAGIAASTEEPSVIFQSGHLTLPPVCCCCLQPATDTFSVPIKVNSANEELPVPLCSGCAATIRRKWWTLVLLLPPLVAAICGVIVALIPGGDTAGRWGVFGIFTFFGSLFAVAILPRRLVRPYSLQVVDANRTVFRLRAANPDYTKLIAQTLAER